MIHARSPKRTAGAGILAPVETCREEKEEEVVCPDKLTRRLLKVSRYVVDLLLYAESLDDASSSPALLNKRLHEAIALAERYSSAQHRLADLFENHPDLSDSERAWRIKLIFADLDRLFLLRDRLTARCRGPNS